MAKSVIITDRAEVCTDLCFKVLELWSELNVWQKKQIFWTKMQERLSRLVREKLFRLNKRSRSPPIKLGNINRVCGEQILPTRPSMKHGSWFSREELD